MYVSINIYNFTYINIMKLWRQKRKIQNRLHGENMLYK